MSRSFLIIVGLFFAVSSAHSAYEQCFEKKAICLEPNATKTINGVEVTRPCWGHQYEYDCIDSTAETTCPNEDLSLWNLEYHKTQTHYLNDPSMPILGSTSVYTRNEQTTFSCGESTIDTFCEGNPNCDFESLNCSVLTGPTTVIAGDYEPNEDGIMVSRNTWRDDTLIECAYQDNSSCFASDEECQIEIAKGKVECQKQLKMDTKECHVEREIGNYNCGRRLEIIIDKDIPFVKPQKESWIKYGNNRFLNYTWYQKELNRQRLRLHTRFGTNNRTAGGKYEFWVDDPKEYSALYIQGNLEGGDGSLVWHQAGTNTPTILAKNTDSYSWDNSNNRYWASGHVTTSTTYAPTVRNVLPLLKPGWNTLGGTVRNIGGGDGYITVDFIFERPPILRDNWVSECQLSCEGGTFNQGDRPVCDKYATPAGYEFCYNEGETCVEPGETRVVDGYPVTRDCWRYDQSSRCYTELKDSCTSEELTGWNYESSANEVYLNDDPLQQLLSYDYFYSNNEHWELNCDNDPANVYCRGDAECDLTPLGCKLEAAPKTILDGWIIPNSDGVPILRDKWVEQNQYYCSKGNKNETCAKDVDDCQWVGFQCIEEDILKPSDPIYGKCIRWEDQYQCPGDSSQTCSDNSVDKNHCYEIVGGTSGGGADVSSATAWESTLVCYGDAPELCNTDTDCTLTTTKCVEYDALGLCSKQEQIYQCEKEIEVCDQTQLVEKCPDSMSHTDQPPSLMATSNFAEAATSLAMVDAMKEGLSTNNRDEPTFFEGIGHTCNRITDDATLLAGSVGAVAAFVLGSLPAAVPAAMIPFMDLDCCKNDPDKIEMQEMYCDYDDQQLAAAIMAKRAHRTDGTYVDKTFCVVPDPLGGCLYEIDVRERRDYCYYDSVLGRIVAVEGRKQLAQLAATTPSATQKATLNFNYFSTANSWSVNPINVNGNWIQYWRWSSDCKDPNKQGELATNNPKNSPLTCPTTPTTYLASCAKKVGDTSQETTNALSAPDCGPLPIDPRTNTGDWEIAEIGISQPEPIAISQYAITTGQCQAERYCRITDMATKTISEVPGVCSSHSACDNDGLCIDKQIPSTCEFDVSAYEGNVGGRKRITTSISWQLYAVDEGWSPSMSMGVFEIQGYQYPFDGPRDHQSSLIRYRNTYSGGQWVEVSLPLLLDSYGYQLIADPLTTITGSCSSNFCVYNLDQVITLTAKSFGTKGNPNCEGFTVHEFTALDIGKMDLSDFIAEVITEMPDNETLAQEIENQMDLRMPGDVQELRSALESGTPMGMGQGSTVIKADPDNGYGPLRVKATAASTYTFFDGTSNIDTVVNAVTFDWGDGNQSTASKGASGGFEAVHEYSKVSSETTYTLTATYETANGSFTSSTTVVVWNRPPTSDGTAGGGQIGAEKEYLPTLIPGVGDIREADMELVPNFE